MAENVFQVMALGIMGRFNLEQIARELASIPADGNSNFNDNVPVVYSELLTIEQRREFEDTFNTIRPGLFDLMLGTLDQSVGSETARFPANPAAVAAVRGLPSAEPTYRKPAVFMTTTYDPVVPSGNTYSFFEEMASTKAAQRADSRGMLKAAQFYTLPLKAEYTTFEPGAKSPSRTLSIIAAGGSGVGHCTFTSTQHSNGVKALMAMIDAKTPKAIAAAKRTVYRTPGVSRDRLFAPPPLKYPLLTAR